VHHYLFALLLLPLTRGGHRRSALLQACLLGVFIHGAAKWGFASMWCGAHPAGVV
jgi:hypothetical protein